MIRKKIVSRIVALFDLNQDTDYLETDASIRKNVDFKSANSWTLVFAIFIASVGLNTNSAAVIIGAMLISPLMGPIVGIGYGLGVNDFALLRRALTNLLIAVLISLVTSTIYFLLSPLTEAHSELLSRTSPTFYDVLIAFFGGATGIVALSRKEKSNAIPGVAIATALMPPLCTAGFGLANLNISYFFGAFYLFIINSVFIAISTYVFVRLIRFTKVEYTGHLKQKLIDRWVMICAGVVIIPSLFIAWFLMQETSFKLRAEKFIDNELIFPDSLIVSKKIKYSLNSQSIVITIVGKEVKKELIQSFKKKLSIYNLDPASFELKQVSLEDQSHRTLDQKKGEVVETDLQEIKHTGLQPQLESQKKSLLVLEIVAKEIKIFSPKVKELFQIRSGFILTWHRQPNNQEKLTAEAFLRTRLANQKMVIHHVSEI